MHIFKILFDVICDILIVLRQSELTFASIAYDNLNGKLRFFLCVFTALAWGKTMWGNDFAELISCAVRESVIFVGYETCMTSVELSYFAIFCSDVYVFDVFSQNS